MSRAESRNALDRPASVFAALGDTTRLELLSRLSDGQVRSITQLVAALDLSRQGITKHLRVMERAGIVCSVRVGRESRFTCVPERVEEAQSYLDRVAGQWDDALLRLRAFVEE